MEKQQYSILIVEDEEIWSSSLREILEEEGYKVWVATNKQKAEELLTSGKLAFDLVTMDMMLSKTEPVQLAKGWHLLDVCAGLAPRPAVIVVSAAELDRKHVRKLFEEYGISGDISKDDSDFYEEFKRKIKRTLGIVEENKTAPTGIMRRESLQKRLTSHRRILYRLEEKLAEYTKLEAPVSLLNQIEDKKGEIASLEAELCKFEKGPDHTDSD